jgi:GTP cyclohydrolase I
MTTIKNWLQENIIDDERALSWFESEHQEQRIRHAFRDLLSGYQIDPKTILATTRLVEPEERVGKVIISNINFYSLCPHHFLPYFGQINIHYLPGKRILGLGKFPRLVEAYCRRLQIQEDLVRDIAMEIMQSGEAKGVYVEAYAKHLCICSRGPIADNVMTKTEYRAGEIDYSCE